MAPSFYCSFKKIIRPESKDVGSTCKMLAPFFGFQTSMQKAKCGGMFCIPSTSTEELGT